MRGFLVTACVATAALLGCSSAGRLLSRQQPFDLMPAPPAREPARHQDAPDTFDAIGPLHVSPDGRWIAYESERGGVHGVWVARRDSSEATRRVSGGHIASSPLWSPDATRLLFLARSAKAAPSRTRTDSGADDWTIWIADPVDGSSHRLESVGGGPPAGPSWFPDSRRICYGDDNWLIVVDAGNGATRGFRLPNESGRIVGAPAVSPDGRHIVFAVAGDGAWMASLSDGAITQVVSEASVDGFAWAPGGRQIAYRNARDGRWNVRIVK